MKVISLTLLFFIMSCAHEKKVDPIAAGLKRHNFSFHQCYYESDSYMGRNETDPGEVLVRFIVEKDGKIQDEEIVQSSFKDPNLHACILDQIRQVKFGEIKTKTEVLQPINFVPVTE